MQKIIKRSKKRIGNAVKIFGRRRDLGFEKDNRDFGRKTVFFAKKRC